LIRVARFFNNTPKQEKDTELPQNIPNGYEIYQMSVKYTNIFFAIPSKMYSNLDFWFETKPSGNPTIDPRIFFVCQICRVVPERLFPSGRLEAGCRSGRRQTLRRKIGFQHHKVKI
jgi:hypothetical protein